MVKIPTYTSQTQPRSPVTRSRPFINTGGEQVGNAVSRFADAASDLAMRVNEKNQRIADDRLQTEMMNELTLQHTDIFNKYKTSKDVRNGASDYFDESQKLIQSIYDKYTTQNKHVSEWFFNKSNDMVRGNYPTIENAIFSNNRDAVAEDVNDQKKLFFNTWLTADMNENKLVKQMQEENMFGSETVVGIYDKLSRANMQPNLSKEQFNKNLEDELSILHATQLINNNLGKFYEIYNNGGYNGLDPKTKADLKAKADGATKQAQSMAVSALTTQKTEIVAQIKDVIDVTKDGYAPNVSDIKNLMETGTALHEQLVANGKDGLREELVDLNNSLQVYDYMSPIKQMPLDMVAAEYNAIKSANMQQSGTADFDSLNVSKEKTLKKYLDFRSKNDEDNLLAVAVSAGMNIQPIDFSQVDSLEPLQLRYKQAITAGLQFKQDPQFFVETEKQQIATILNSGSEEDITKLIATISTMAQDKGPTAFQQIAKLDGANGIAHIGTLFNVTGSSSELQGAIKAFALKDDPNTKAILNQFKPTAADYSNIKSAAFQTFQISPLLDDRQVFRMMSEASDLIFQGLILSDPELALQYESGLEPDVTDQMEQAVQVAAGYFNGFGGLEEYNGHMITVPGVMMGETYHRNADYKGKYFDGLKTLEEMLDENMTDSLLEQATSSMPYLPGELTTGGPRNATVEDLFNQDMVHLIPYGFGQYTFAFGNDPRTTDIEVRDQEGNLVIFDLTKIYNSINY